MYFKFISVVFIFFLVACSSGTQIYVAEKSIITYAEESSISTPVNSVASTSDTCIDNLNFLRKVGGHRYERLSKKYVGIINEFKFLKVNNNIMG